MRIDHFDVKSRNHRHTSSFYHQLYKHKLIIEYTGLKPGLHLLLSNKQFVEKNKL